MDTRAVLDHQFLVAAYTITWTIQLGYLLWLGVRWRAQKRPAGRAGRIPH
jgi:CcmD family protein